MTVRWESAVNADHLDGSSGTNPVVIVTAPEEIDVTVSDAFRDDLLAAVRAHTTTVVNMEETRFCDSSGMRALLMARRHASEVGGDLTLAGATAEVRRIMSIFGAERLLPIFSDVAGAVASAGRQ